MASCSAAGCVAVEVLFGVHASILAHAFAEGKGFFYRKECAIGLHSEKREMVTLGEVRL